MNVKNIFRLKAFGMAFLERNRDVFLLSLLIVLISFFGPMIYLQLTDVREATDMEQEAVVIVSENLDDEELTWQSIFFHNFMILLPACIGVFSFGFVSFWYILLQGYLLSTSIFYLSKEFSFWFVFKYTFFHGVFEILAIILVGAFALKPAVVIFKCIILKKPFFQKRDFKDMSILFVLYVFFLLLAALIEGLITTRL